MKVALALLVLLTGCTKRDQLRGEVEALRAYANEGRWLAEERAHLPTAYLRVERIMLAEKVTEARDEVEKSFPDRQGLLAIANALEPAVRFDAPAETFATLDDELAAEMPR